MIDHDALLRITAGYAESRNSRRWFLSRHPERSEGLS
jgi:hypothetical protein